jgi:hypothetical protein
MLSRKAIHKIISIRTLKDWVAINQAGGISFNSCVKAGVKVRLIMNIKGGSKTTSIRGGIALNSRKKPFAANMPVHANQHKKPAAVNKSIFFFFIGFHPTLCKQ